MGFAFSPTPTGEASARHNSYRLDKIISYIYIYICNLVIYWGRARITPYFVEAATDATQYPSGAGGGGGGGGGEVVRRCWPAATGHHGTSHSGEGLLGTADFQTRKNVSPFGGGAVGLGALARVF